MKLHSVGLVVLCFSAAVEGVAESLTFAPSSIRFQQLIRSQRSTCTRIYIPSIACPGTQYVVRLGMIASCVRRLAFQSPSAAATVAVLSQGKVLAASDAYRGRISACHQTEPRRLK
jgi:hypothetical protein